MPTIDDQEFTLRAALLAAKSDYSNATAHNLRDLICDYVDAAKAAGLKPEQVIIEVKRIAAEAGWHRRLVFDDSPGSASSDNGGLVQDITTICIERYFSS